MTSSQRPKQIGKSVELNLGQRGESLCSEHRISVSSSYIAATISRCRERLPAGGLVSIHEVPTFLSFDAVRCVPAIRMRRSSRPSAVWTVFVSRTNRILVARLTIHCCRALGGRDCLL